MTDRPDPTRRSLLAGVPLGSAALALGAAPAQAAVAEETAPDPRQPRFKTTDRVANFYKLARDS